MRRRRTSRKHVLPSGFLRPQTDEAGTLFGNDSFIPYDRKTEQLCQQAHEALSLAIASCRDPVARACQVESVVPSSGPHQLLVHVIPDEDGSSLEDLAAALERLRGYLRHEVAATIHRKRAPELRFVVRPREAGDE